MATGAQSWSTTAASNATADGSVNWAEGMAPSAVNNSARAEMASVAMHIGDNSGVILTTGTTAAYTITSKQISTSNTDGRTVAVRFHAANNASATLSADGATAAAIELYAGQALVGGEFKAGSVARLSYMTTSTSWVVNNFTALTTTVSLPGTLAVTNATALSSALTVSGPATLSSSLTVSLAALFTTGITAAAIAGAMVAVQADQETGTSLIKAVAPGVQHFHPSAAKGWTYADTGGNSIIDYNVSSVTDGGAGIATVNWATDFTTVGYSLSCAVHKSGASSHYRFEAFAAGTARLDVTNSAGSAADPDGFFIQAFGDFA